MFQVEKSFQEHGNEGIQGTSDTSQCQGLTAA